MKTKKGNMLSGPYHSAIWSWRVVILALVFTLALFLLLPFSEMVSTGQGDRSQLLLRRVNIATLFQPPPPPKASPPRQPKSAKSKLPKPKLIQTPQQLAPLQIALGLDLGDVGGDFSLDLSLAPESQPQLGEEMVFELSQVDQPPRPLVKVPPFYPLSARAKGIEGKVELVFVVQTDGSVSDIEATDSFPGKIFVQAALRAVRQWRFKPGTKDGQPVATRVRLPLRFQLED
jgi:protein TonB